jgi:hypothetical protein
MYREDLLAHAYALFAGVDQAHEQIADSGAIQRLVEQ